MRAIPRSLFGRLVFVQIAYGLVVVLAFALIAEYTHTRFHYKATQYQARDWAAQIAARNSVLGDVRAGRFRDEAEVRATLSELGNSHPGAQFYIVGNNGRINVASVAHGQVRRTILDISTVRAWLTGAAALPATIEDPVNPERRRIFSAASLGFDRYAYLVMVLQGPDTGGFLAAHTDFLLSDSLKLAVGVMIPALSTAVLLLFMILRPIRRINRTLAELDRARHESGVRANVDGRGHGLSELDQVARNVDAMAREIIELLRTLTDEDRTRRELFATLSHDLRTPLTVVKSVLETLSGRSDSGISPSAAKLIWQASGEVQRLERLLAEQFELANLQRSDYRIEAEPFFIEEVLHDASQKFVSRAAAVGLELAVHGDGPPDLRVEADAMLIERVLDNLIDNAIRHADGATRIELDVRASAHGVEVRVSDDGPGLPRMLADWLAGPVWQPAPRSKCPSSGSGLGLRIVRRILELHDSGLVLERSDEGGTRLSFRLRRYANDS